MFFSVSMVSEYDLIRTQTLRYLVKSKEGLKLGIRLNLGCSFELVFLEDEKLRIQNLKYSQIFDRSTQQKRSEDALQTRIV